ncbi:MAG: hypothetical protein SFX18_18800 [Pirellulales bacterium]|nr:hypothetical protein [Pirellulales bacterium]
MSTSSQNDYPLPTATPEEPRGLFGGIFQALGQFIYWVVLLPVRLFQARRELPNTLTIYSVHPSFFLWLLVAVGFSFAAVVQQWPDTASILGWAYVWVLLYFLCTLLYDFSFKKLALWVGIFLLIWLIAKYFEMLQSIVIVGHLIRYLTSLDPRLDPGTATVLSWLLLLPWVAGIAQMVLNGRKRITPNDISEFHFGEGTEMTDRTGLRFRTNYRDILETLLTFGGGDLIAVDNHQKEIKRWNNIVGLYFLWGHLDRILHQRAVVETTDEELGEEQ